MTKLSVNVNKIALLRNTRDYGVPDVVRAARTCIDAGAHGITVHPRPDQRHVKPGDVFDLAELLDSHRHIEYNLEGNPFEGGYLDLVEQIRPTQATLVPDSPDQRTSDHGWDMARDGGRLRPIVERLRALDVRVSLFMDPDADAITGVARAGADRVELYTESYAAAFRRGEHAAVLDRYTAAATAAAQQGLGINAGHDLNQANLGPFRGCIPELLEVSIGHELTADALWMGLGEAVKAYLHALAD